MEQKDNSLTRIALDMALHLDKKFEELETADDFLRLFLKCRMAVEDRSGNIPITKKSLGITD